MFWRGASCIGRRVLGKAITYVGLDVHKDTIAVALAEAGVRGDVREYGKVANGFVTLPCRERKVSAAQELLGRCDCGPPRGHRGAAKRAARLSGDEMALDVEGVVDGGVG